MFKLFFTYILPLIAPTLLYLLWNWIQMRRALAGKRAAPPPTLENTPWLVLVGAGISLVLVVLLALTFSTDNSAPGTRYVPPHMEDGRIVPGESR